MTEVISSIYDFEKYLKKTKKVVEEALDFSLGPEMSLIHISEPTRRINI